MIVLANGKQAIAYREPKARAVVVIVGGKTKTVASGLAGVGDPQIVQLPNGTLDLFAADQDGVVSYTSSNGGATWTRPGEDCVEGHRRRTGRRCPQGRHTALHAGRHRLPERLSGRCRRVDAQHLLALLRLRRVACRRLARARADRVLVERNRKDGVPLRQARRGRIARRLAHDLDGRDGLARQPRAARRRSQGKHLRFASRTVTRRRRASSSRRCRRNDCAHGHACEGLVLGQRAADGARRRFSQPPLGGVDAGTVGLGCTIRDPPARTSALPSTSREPGSAYQLEAAAERRRLGRRDRQHRLVAAIAAASAGSHRPGVHTRRPRSRRRLPGCRRDGARRRQDGEDRRERDGGARQRAVAHRGLGHCAAGYAPASGATA